MSRRDPRVHIHHMLDHAAEALEMTRGRSWADRDTDRMLNFSLVRLMEVLGEASMRVPADFRSRYPNVPWRQTSDLRNRVIPVYDEVDFDTLWEIIRDQAPPLLEQMEAILDQNGRLTDNA